ncbi:MAG: carboxylesterase family protein, partial [Williamsia herbipolensis]|nr:carboxylesterase family protein [Williamsia herbipolensis]
MRFLPLVRAGVATLSAVAVLAACTSGSGTAPGGGTTASRPSSLGTAGPGSASAPVTSPPVHGSPVPAPLTVETTSGRLHGLATSTSREFLGVRYAKPPTGPRRWTMPVPEPKASGTVPATEPGASCAQAGSAPGASATASTSEDCLFLNVTTPRTMTPGERLPVMVWWHGGGYTSGSGSAYDAQRLAARGVVVVTVNYRLGVFGYLSLPGLKGSGDFGLGDQILATRWAKHNAAAFGGDPDDITVFGESA